MAIVQSKNRGRPKLIPTRECAHCHQKTMGKIKRGLCPACYQREEIRPLYARVLESQRIVDHEPTAEEVDRCVSEQFQCLPDWWWISFERELSAAEVEECLCMGGRLPSWENQHGQLSHSETIEKTRQKHQFQGTK